MVVGSIVGIIVGNCVVGVIVGSIVGIAVGGMVGSKVGGCPVGISVGAIVGGSVVGVCVGYIVGCIVVGNSVGTLVGTSVGISVVGASVVGFTYTTHHIPPPYPLCSRINFSNASASTYHSHPFLTHRFHFIRERERLLAQHQSTLFQRCNVYQSPPLLSITLHSH